MLNPTLLTAAGLLLAVSLPGQTALSGEEARYYASLTRQEPGALTSLPLQIKADLTQPVGVYEAEYGGLFIPDANLTEEALRQAKEKPLPVGELWFRYLAPMKEGWVVSENDLHFVRITHNSERVKVPCCPLGIRRNDQGGLELLVYGKGPQPLLNVPLKSTVLSDAKPVALLAERESDSGLITLRLFGRYEAQFRVTELIPW